MKKIRILFAIDGIEFGGGERVFAQIINGLSLDQYEIFFISSHNALFYSSIKHNKLHIHSIDFSKRFSPFLLFQLIKLIKDHRIDIIHGQGARAEFYARIAKRLSGNTKYVSTIAMPVEGFDVGSFRKTIYRFIDIITESYVDRFIVVSDALKKTLIKNRRIETNKIIIIYNGIELDYYQPEIERNDCRKQFGISIDAPLIGAIGRMVWQKGFGYLIAAIPMIIEIFPDIKFLFVGDGPLKKKIENLARRFKIERHVVFTGFRNDIPEILSVIDLLVVPSIIEGFPMITLEAMAMAKPIIASKIDGITEQITDGEHGILVPPKDSGALADAIIRVFSDKNNTKKMGTAARKRAEKDFSIKKMVFETEEIYQLLCHQ